MYKRVSGVLFVLALGVGACGGDDDTAGDVVDSCTPMAPSVPSSAGDPCPQTKEAGRPDTCPVETYNAVATCDTNGTWKKAANGAVDCKCLPKNGGGAGNTAAGAMACGDGKIDKTMGEECDGTALDNMTCATLDKTTTGSLSCSKMTCRFDMSMCVKSAAMSMGGGGENGM